MQTRRLGEEESDKGRADRNVGRELEVLRPEKLFSNKPIYTVKSECRNRLSLSQIHCPPNQSTLALPRTQKYNLQ